MSELPENTTQTDPKRWRRLFEYVLVRIAVTVFSFVPMSAVSWVGSRIGDLLRRIDRRHRERAYAQVKDRLGLEGPDADRFVRDNFRNYGKIMVEFSKLSKMQPGDIDKHTEYGTIKKHFHDLLAEGNGIIIITPHFGNWEWSSSTSRSLGLTGGAVARPLDNLRVNELVRTIRERNGFRILDKTGAIRKALGILKKKGAVGVLIDQDGGRGGVMSPFLGKPASTMTFPVDLALRTGAPMVVVGCMRRENGSKRFVLTHRSEPFRVNPDADRDEEIRRMIDELNAETSRIIMQAPEQWLWVHRRWKTTTGS